MLEQFHLKSLHLESTKQERLFLSLMAVMGIVMEHEQKICQTELLNTRTIQTPKTPKCILLMNKTWKNHGKCLILTDLEQDKMVSFKHKVHLP